nr:response regulator [Desulfobulbaceae bacterium]
MEEKIKILVVDDVPVNLDLLMAIVSSVEEYEVTSAGDGFKAMDIIRQEPVDMLVTDLMMPGMDGIELARQAIEYNSAIKALMVSAADTADRGLIVKAMRVGISDFIPKPVNLDELLLSLRRVALQVRKDKRSEEKQQKISLYFSAMEQSVVSILLTDSKGNIEYVNPFFCTHSGYSFEDVVGKNPRLLGDETETPIGFNLWNHIREAGEWRGEFKNKKKNGELYWESAVITAVKNDAGEVTNFVIIKEDITEKKKWQKDLDDQQIILEKLVKERTIQLADTNKYLRDEIAEREEIQALREQENLSAMKQDKLASLGEIATGVAHEINQPLTYINTVLQVSLEKFRNGQVDPEKFIKKFERAKYQTDRITTIITHLRAFGRADDDVILPVDLVKIMENSLILLSEKLRLRSITLNKKFEENLPLINGNSNKLEQLFINFFQNSIDALDEKVEGTITVSMTNDTEAGTVVLQFSDDGSGMSDEVREKIFEPFFTTKEVGKGTGLGMAIVFGIVQVHKGTVVCSSQPGQGTTFTVTFPAISSGM